MAKCNRIMDRKGSECGKPNAIPLPMSGKHICRDCFNEIRDMMEKEFGISHFIGGV